MIEVIKGFGLMYMDIFLIKVQHVYLNIEVGLTMLGFVWSLTLMLPIEEN